MEPTKPEVPEPPVLPTVSTSCRDFLAGGRVEARRVPSPRGGPGCGIDEPVLLSAIKLADGRRIAVADAGPMRCDLARGFSAWVTGEFATVLKPTAAGSMGSSPVPLMNAEAATG